MKPLGERLIEAGLINETQLQTALREQQRTKEYLGKVLIRLGFANEQAVAAALPGSPGPGEVCGSRAVLPATRGNAARP